MRRLRKSVVVAAEEQLDGVVATVSETVSVSVEEQFESSAQVLEMVVVVAAAWQLIIVHPLIDMTVAAKRQLDDWLIPVSRHRDSRDRIKSHI